jgi:hypothetical protein
MANDDVEQQIGEFGLMMERLSWEVFAADATRERQKHAGDYFMLS